MTDEVIIRTPNGDFDLFGSENIVQTISIFNLSDITSRSGEYTNLIKFPLTNNNRRIVEYADYMTSVNTFPYRKVEAQLIVNGLVIKNGFIAVPEISDVISGRFYSGNTVFYDLIKGIYLGDLIGWSAYDHVWNLTNAVASSDNTSGYTYPVMDYNGQNLASDIVDVRKILPATYTHTALALMAEHFGYTYQENFGYGVQFSRSLLPYVNKNPTYPSSYLLLNSLDASKSLDTGFADSLIFYYGVGPGSMLPKDIPLSSYPGGGNVFRRVKFDVFGAGTSTYWNQGTDQYTVQAPGVYTYNVNIQASASHSFVDVTATDFVTYQGHPVPFVSGSDIEIILYAVTGGNYQQIEAGLYSGGISWSGSVSMNQGDFFFIVYRQTGVVRFKPDPNVNSSQQRHFYVELFTDILDTSTFTLELDPSLTFGNPIVYSSILPKIKCSEFLKDMAVRFGIIISVDDDNKTLTATNIQVIKDNIPNAIDMSDKLDDSEPVIHQFSLDTYAQNNHFKHKEDKSLASTPQGTDYTLNINNTSLELEKVLYESPFAASENVDFNSVLTAKIDLYNATTGKFDKDVKPRICFRKGVTGGFKFTDGSTTSGYIDTNVIWFIDLDQPDKSMGFGTSLIPANSQPLIDILQNLRLVKANLKFDVIDIKNINCLLPIKLSQYNSYFIISSINQFSYNKPNVTEVDLIKIN